MHYLFNTRKIFQSKQFKALHKFFGQKTCFAIQHKINLLSQKETFPIVERNDVKTFFTSIKFGKFSYSSNVDQAFLQQLIFYIFLHFYSCKNMLMMSDEINSQGTIYKRYNFGFDKFN